MMSNPQRTTIQVLDFLPQGHRSFDLFLLGLAAELRIRGWRTIHVFTGEPPERFREQLQELDSPYVVSPMPLDRSKARVLASKLKPFRPTVIQTTFMSPFNLSIVSLKRAIGAGYWIVADHSSGAASRKFGLKKLAARARGILADRVVDRIVAVSDFVARRDVERNMLPQRKIRTIYNGIDSVHFSPLGHKPTGEGPLTIVFAGQLIPEKGVDLLIESVRRVVEQSGREIRLKIAGVGRLKEELQALANAALPGQVEFLGQVVDMATLFRSADLAVFPSRWEEAFGLVVAEAMGCGTPVIASDAGGIPEVIGLDEQAGMIFRKDDVDDLTRKLLELVNDRERRERIRTAGPERVAREFSLKRMVDQYAAIYEEFDR